ncbi:MAG: EamA family transporter [Candidatus Omnitrophota bacterium]|jgi:uncharacterized membrane protein
MINLKILLIILFAEVWGVVGQILYKKGVTRIGTPKLRDFNSCISFAKKVFTSPMIMTGLVSITTGLIIWIVALAQAELSLVFPITSMQYIVTMVAAHYLLNEKINKLKLIGTVLVMIGITLVALS